MRLLVCVPIDLIFAWGGEAVGGVAVDPRGCAPISVEAATNLNCFMSLNHNRELTVCAVR